MKYFIPLFFLFFSTATLAQHPEVKRLEIGTQAPDFKLLGVDNNFYTLNDFKDFKFLVVLFTCNHCPTAQAYEEKFKKYVDHYKPQSVGFVAISPTDPAAVNLAELGYSDMGDGFEDMQIRAKDMEYNFPYLYDGENQKASIAYGPVATPHVFVFDKDRKLRYSGRIDDTENPYIEPRKTDMVDALDALLKGKEVTVPSTKTFGCSVKWSWKNEWTKKLRQIWAEEAVELEDMDLNKLKNLIKNEGDKLRLINIWATWCGPCIIEFPEFVTINRMYRNRDFEFISISTDKAGKKEKALEFLKKQQASNTNYIFSGENIYDLIEVVDKDWQGNLPYTLLIAPDGEIIYKISGEISPLALKKEIVQYLGRYYADDE